ncbi:hypothetical protein LSAT2_026109, partial [Lamellibrachia satsuma]
SMQNHPSANHGPRLPMFSETKDELDSYLQRFERYAMNERWPLRGEVLFRLFHPNKSENIQKQLVVPHKFRQQVLQIGHETLLSGHQGTKKTLQRIMLNFYWPGISGEVKRFCASCDICQRTVNKGNVRRAPLQKMPIINTPFQKVSIDLIGPLSPVTERGNRWILTLVDSATRYPEAVALQTTNTVEVAEKLLEGPMYVLRKLWTNETMQEEVSNVYQYVVDLRNRLEKT